jgi:hypothetical protein
MPEAAVGKSGERQFPRRSTSPSRSAASAGRGGIRSARSLRASAAARPGSTLGNVAEPEETVIHDDRTDEEKAADRRQIDELVEAHRDTLDWLRDH